MLEHDTVKELIKRNIEGKVAKVQAIDGLIIGPMIRKRESYNRQQVFAYSLETLLEATKGIGLIEFLEFNFTLSKEENRRMHELKKSYSGLKSCIYDIYKSHSTGRYLPK